MHAVLKNAMARRDLLKRQISELEVDLTRLDSWIDMYRDLATGTDEGQIRDSGTERLDVVPRVERPRGLTRAEGAPIIRRIIVDNGKPMQRGALLDALELNGTPVGGNDPSNNLGTMMWRMKDKFVNLEGFGYWPEDLEYLPAKYHPVIGAAASAYELPADVVPEAADPDEESTPSFPALLRTG